MRFVVKATGPGLSAVWLSPKSDIGSHTLGPRKAAVIFPTDAQARAAVVEATESLSQLGLVFSVESAD
jgi:hypothetical protein